MCQRLLRSSAILLLLQFLCCISNGAAIKCFVCDSSVNPECADLSSNTSIEPEECTLTQTRSVDTWLYELNRFSYFDNGANKSPLMNCQKVIARNPNTNKLVTARFCQLDTGDSNACEILRAKMHGKNGNNGGQQQQQRDRDQQQQRRKGNGQDTDGVQSPEQEFFCDICNKDRCNGAATVTLTSLATIGVLVMLLKQLLPRPLGGYCCSSC